MRKSKYNGMYIVCCAPEPYSCGSNDLAECENCKHHFSITGQAYYTYYCKKTGKLCVYADTPDCSKFCTCHIPEIKTEDQHENNK